jgi:hypothetical protein
VIHRVWLGWLVGESADWWVGGLVSTFVAGEVAAHYSCVFLEAVCESGTERRLVNNLVLHVLPWYSKERRTLDTHMHTHTHALTHTHSHA